VPTRLAAAVGHLLFGDFRLDLTTSLLIGCLPGVYLGAQLSARAPAGLVRRALALVLLASGLKLLDLSDVAMVTVLGAVVVVGPALWMLARVRHGLPARARILSVGAPRRADGPADAGGHGAGPASAQGSASRTPGTAGVELSRPGPR